MRALTALVLLKCGLHATCVLPPLGHMMQASEQALVNEGLEEGREEKVCFDVGGRFCWCRVPAEAAVTLCDGELCWTPSAGLFSVVAMVGGQQGARGRQQEDVAAVPTPVIVGVETSEGNQPFLMAAYGIAALAMEHSGAGRFPDLVTAMSNDDQIHYANQ
jgi:hypothetical protein